MLWSRLGKPVPRLTGSGRLCDEGRNAQCGDYLDYLAIGFCELVSLWYGIVVRRFSADGTLRLAAPHRFHDNDRYLRVWSVVY